MDAVITYVNDMEPIWRMSFVKNIGFSDTSNDVRFRCLGTLRFVLRGISEHMKFIDRVFLVVSNIEQVPDYVNDNVIIVTHDMFIPKDYLPTFNALTIECFLWNIPDLSEEFIYFKDDMIPISKMVKEDFFIDGLPCLKFSEKKVTSNMFNSIIQIDNYYASKLAKNKKTYDFLWTNHIMTPFLKTEYINSFKVYEKEITTHISPIRKDTQFSQHYFSNCLFYLDKYIDHSINHIYVGTNITVNTLKDIIMGIKNEKVICFNDYGLLKDCTLFETIYNINETLSIILPHKCIYEK